MPYADLRDWITKVDDLGELRRVNKADWNVEIGSITEVVHRRRNAPALLFDEIDGYPPGFRILANTLGSCNRVALTWGLPFDLTERGLMEALREKYYRIKPIPPRVVKDGPVMENVYEGERVDLYQFPTPKWHAQDGGRYIGTGSVDITMDPDENWVNLGTYRVMIQDKNHVGFYISPGKHGRIQREKIFAQNRPVPVAISCGHDPVIFMVGSTEFPYGHSEYDYAGGIKGDPIEVIRGRITGLPIPATAEIVLEGEALPQERRPEGPFGEWTGYYASAARLEPVIEVKAVYHRYNPILIGSPPSKPPAEQSFYRAFLRSILIEEELKKVGVPDVSGVWCHEVGGGRLLVIVGIKQRYPGHAKQAASIVGFCHVGAYLGRYIVVVDDDIDITDINDVMWAICTRTDPVRSIDIIQRCWSGPLDPAIPTGEKGFSSRAIIDACKPFEWLGDFPASVGLSIPEKESILQKWGKVIS
ncbi:MAG: UbiD family decarboxylase [Chloroflexi bacterium]|nr:UbiD family decarboxylase [Chloroflexota bacterium]